MISLASETSVASMTSTASTTSVASTTLQPHFIKKNTELEVSINPDTKMTYPGLLMWEGSSKIHFFIDFWHPFSWRLWRARNIKKIRNNELGINAPIS
jgi:hypothetical protein